MKSRLFLIALMSLVTLGAEAGECIVFYSRDGKTQNREIQILARDLVITSRDSLKTYISNDNRLVMTVNRINIENKTGTPVNGSVMVSLQLDGKPILASTANTIGSSLFLDGATFLSDGSSYGVQCSVAQAAQQ